MTDASVIIQLRRALTEMNWRRRMVPPGPSTIIEPGSLEVTFRTVPTGYLVVPAALTTGNCIWRNGCSVVVRRSHFVGGTAVWLLAPVSGLRLIDMCDTRQPPPVGALLAAHCAASVP